MKLRICIFYLILLIPCFLFAETSLDSLLIEIQKLEKSEKGLEWARAKYYLGEEFRNSGKFTEAISEFHTALEMATIMGDTRLETDCILGLAKCQQRLNNFSEALQHYNNFLQNFHSEYGQQFKAFAYSQVADIYQNLGDYQKAYDLQMQSLQLFEVAQDTNGIASSTYSLATIFFYQHRYDEALKNYEAAYQLGENANNGRLIYSCLAAIGSVYERMGKMEISLDYSKKALQMAREIDYPYGVAYAYGNLAAGYLHLDKYKLAEGNFLKSLSMKESIGDKWGMIGSNFGLGETYVAWGFPEKAIPFINAGMEISKSIDSKSRILEGYFLLSQCFDAQNDKDKAHLYLSKYVALKDSVLNEKTVEEMGKSKRRYEIQKREQEIKLLTAENKIFEKNQKIQYLRNYFFASAILLLLVFSSWIFTRSRLQQKVNHLLEDKNNLLNQKNEEIRVKNQQLAASNENLSQFAYVASHDLKEPLRMINSYTRLLEKRYTSLFDENAKEFMFYITDAVGRMSTLLDDLLEFSRAGNKNFTNDLLDFTDVMIIVQSNLKIQLAESNATLKFDADSLPSIHANRTQLVQLIQNLVSNGVKFRGERDPVVTINCVKEKNRFVFSVADNGIGISESNLNKVFEMFRRLHTREEYSGTGIGLATCKRIVDHYGGDIWVESTVGQGSTFFFTIPVPVEEMVLA